MPDFLGIDKKQEQQPQQTTDFLGAKVPIAFSSQPSLPAAGPGAGAGGGPSAAPATVGGAGVAPSAPQAPEGFGQLANAALGPEAGGGGVGGGEGGSIGAPGGQGAAGIPSLDFSAFGIPAGINIFGNIGARTGNQAADFALNTVAGQGAKLAGLSTNVLGLAGQVLNSPILGVIGGALGMMGLPVTFMSLVHALASMSPTSTASLQAALADPNPESQISTEQAMAIMSGQQMGPAVGTPMTQGTLGWSPANTATAPRPNDPVDTSPTTAPPTDPVAEGFTAAEAAATGQGAAPGPGPGPGPGSGDASDAE